MSLRQALANLLHAGPAVSETARRGNLRVLAGMLGPAFRGLVLQRAKQAPQTDVPTTNSARFDWAYRREFPEMARLYEAAKSSQWNGTTDLDWSVPVDRDDPTRELLPESWLPVSTLKSYRNLSRAEVRVQQHGLLSWILSQFLHGEQGALYAAAQVTEAVPWLDGKLYGSTQVVDEGRHVEVFHRYLTTKLEKRYDINDNLYVLIESLMGDGRWDVKFLGMQILIEGLALGAFGTIRHATGEPLLKELLRYVITDEARHVHYGVLALRDVMKELSERERRDREDWTLEMALLMRNRFLAHEFYEEHWAHAMSRRAWDDLVLDSQLMTFFRRTMFRRVIPNLKRIGLLPERLRPTYQALGFLEYEHGPAAPELTARDLLEDRA